MIGNVACVGLGITAGCCNFLRCRIGCFFVEVEDAYRRALTREPLGDGEADSAGSAGDRGDFAVEPESIAMLRGAAQRETPRFQGMKSF